MKPPYSYAVAVFCGLLVAALLPGHSLPGRAAPAKEPALRLASQRPTPVITTRHPDARGNTYGFEGGRAVKVGSAYHLFTSEMTGNPIWVKMKFGHWTSANGADWRRVSTVFESSGEFEGKDARASLWSPLPVWDPSGSRWNLFYVAYRSQPSNGSQFLLNHTGQIWRAISTRPGENGIGGPYKDAGVVMKPGPDSDSWEGLQGTDSFFPYRAGGQWMALYGSAHSQTLPIKYWLVGLAFAPELGGPWKRRTELNPAAIEKVFIENPIVEPLPSGGFLAVYDSNVADAIGWSYSPDGIHWNPGRPLVIQPRHNTWSHDVRTPLGLIAEGGGIFTVFYTGFEQTPDWPALLAGRGGKARCAIGMVKVQLD